MKFGYPECNLFATAEVQSELDKRGFIKYRIICTLSATMCRLVFQLNKQTTKQKSLRFTWHEGSN